MKNEKSEKTERKKTTFELVKRFVYWILIIGVIISLVTLICVVIVNSSDDDLNVMVQYFANMQRSEKVLYEKIRF